MYGPDYLRVNGSFKIVTCTSEWNLSALRQQEKDSD
jgi:hypothetical protein